MNAPTPTSPDLSGRLLGGKYRLRRLLGRGGMGSVYEALQEDLGRTVAVKCLDPVLATYPEQLERFRREATSAAALGHSNIVSVTDFGSAGAFGEPPFLVMELLSGESLGSLLDRESVLAPERVAFIASQMLSALGAAHGAGIVHRDIKPDNVFLTSTSAFHDLVKVLDFGIAKLGEEQGGPRLTGTGAMLGTPAYMAPEQARGGTVDHRSDLYAVGATMYQALSGRLPHDAPSFPAMLFAIVEQPPEPLARLRPDVSPGLVAVVERAMSKSPDARYPSAEAMRAALAPYLPGTAGVSAPVSSDAPTLAALPNSGGASALPTPAVLRQPSPVTAPSATNGPPTDAAVVQTSPSPTAPHASRSALPIVAAAAVVVALIGGGAAIAITKINADARAAAAATASAAPPVTVTVTVPGPSVSPPPASVAVVASQSASADIGDRSHRPNVVPSARASASAVSASTAAVSALATSTANAPVPSGGKVYGGSVGFWSGNDFSECPGCDYDGWRTAIVAERPAITACFAASVHEPPLHENPYYKVAVSGDGVIGSVVIEGDLPTPNLDRCLADVLRRHPIKKTTSAPGSFKVGFRGECATFHCQ